MAFTYDLSATGDNLIISKIRLEIGDTDNCEDAGVKPNGTNFQDAELLYFYNDEGSDVVAAAARACEALARGWAGQSQNVRIRDYSINTTQKAKDFAAMAKTLREQSGTLYKAGGVPTMPIDGYSNDVNSQQTEAGSDEYWQSRQVLKWPR